MSASRHALVTVLLALAGLAAAVALAVALNRISGDEVGLSGQPLDAGARLVAPVAPPRDSGRHAAAPRAGAGRRQHGGRDGAAAVARAGARSTDSEAGEGLEGGDD